MLTVAAGLLRRDQMLLTAPAGESWHNHAHDAVSALIYVALIAVPLLLARRFRGDRRWRALRLPLAAPRWPRPPCWPCSSPRRSPSWDAVLQRIAVTLPLAALAAVGGRGCSSPGAPARPEVCRTGPGRAGRLW